MVNNYHNNNNNNNNNNFNNNYININNYILGLITIIIIMFNLQPLYELVFFCFTCILQHLSLYFHYFVRQHLSLYFHYFVR